MTASIVRFPWRPRSIDRNESRPLAQRALAVPIGERAAQTPELALEDPEVLLCICEILTSEIERAPATVRDEAEFFYNFLHSPQRAIGLHDERNYFLGELAYLAGGASRFLFRLDEAKLWLQRAETSFALVQNASAHWARISYQRLALLLEEHKLDEVQQLAPMWAETFTRLDMPEDALKCRFLEGLALSQLGELDKAIAVYTAIIDDAERLRSLRLMSQAANNLVGFHANLGDEERALHFAAKALPIQRQLGDRVGLTKLQWSIGDLHRKKGRKAAALEAYREAQTVARETGLRGDLAALHLVIGDLLLETGQEAQAEWEIRAALPIIDEEKMVPEGIAALSLLRESLRRRQIDKQALRELHGYFQEK